MEYWFFMLVKHVIPLCCDKMCDRVPTKIWKRFPWLFPWPGNKFPTIFDILTGVWNDYHNIFQIKIRIFVYLKKKFPKYFEKQESPLTFPDHIISSGFPWFSSPVGILCDILLWSPLPTPHLSGLFTAVHILPCWVSWMLFVWF